MKLGGILAVLLLACSSAFAQYPFPGGHSANSGAVSPITYLRGTGAQCSPSGANVCGVVTTTVTNNFASIPSVASGDTCVAAVTYGSATGSGASGAGTPNVTDAQAGSWTFAYNGLIGGGGYHTAFFSKRYSGSAASVQLTATYTGSSDYFTVQVACFSGITSTSPYDANGVTQNVTGTTAPSTNITLSASNEVIIAYGAGADGTIHAGTNYTDALTSLGTGDILIYRILGAGTSGSQAVNFSQTPTSAVDIVAVSFKNGT